ncbi:hypothetical protein BL253_36555 [Pseudofrankia asymbiotica]|uniref:Uncharacterized protein n=1 Tax=Pseudofrankia asymbiotica TaxID=1834516 RepID=A0A1V2HZC0_9ACTN|nr:hypothetical protein BL253_36555 [Pseudofrankia asymbiotica]
MPMEFGSIDNRASLAALARTGYAGVRLSGHHVMTDMHDRDLVALIALLRDARGVGMRVSWSGECGNLDVRWLRHLDPPRQPDSTLAWSPPSEAFLLARRGPSSILVDDTRAGPRRHIVIDRSTPAAKVLEATDWGRAITPGERAGVQRLAMDGLAFCSGNYCVGLPVRQGVWCV